MNLLSPPPPALPLYETLGVRNDATVAEIRSAYLRRCRQHHPDLNGGVESDEYLAISHAYEVLSDPTMRAAYDRSGVDPGSAGALRAVATEIITKTAFQCIADQMGDVNLLENIKASIGRTLAQHSNEVRRLGVAIAKVEKVAANIAARWKGAEDQRAAILRMIDEQLGKDRHSLATTKQTVELLELALNLLIGASYEMPASEASAIRISERLYPATYVRFTF